MLISKDQSGLGNDVIELCEKEFAFFLRSLFKLIGFLFVNFIFFLRNGMAKAAHINCSGSSITSGKSSNSEMVASSDQKH